MQDWGGDAVMSLEEAAAFLKVGDATVYQLVRGGDLPARKVGREWRFVKSQLVKYLLQGGEGMDQDSGVMQDEQNGGEYRVQDGQEYVALWLPFTREQKAEHIRKAVERGTSVSVLMTDFLNKRLG